MQEIWVGAARAAASTIAAGAFLVGSGAEDEAPNHDTDPAPAAPAQRVAVQRIAATESRGVPELNRAALRAIRNEGLQVRLLGSDQPTDGRHVIPRAQILDDTRYATAASLGGITDPDYRDETGRQIIDHRLAWLVTTEKQSVPFTPSGPAPRTNAEARLRKLTAPVVFDSASALVIIDAMTGEILQAQSISLR